MFLFITTIISLLMACDISNNDPVTEINPECNNAGRCVGIPLPFGTQYTCVCCAPAAIDPDNWCVDHWECDSANPSLYCIEYSGEDCTSVEEYFFVNFGFRADDLDSNEPSDVICYTDPEQREKYGTLGTASLYFDSQVDHVATGFGWPGTVEPSIACDTCSPAYPCVIGTNTDLNVTSGYTYGFQVVLNHFYSPDCAAGVAVYTVDEVSDCDANYDYGQLAYERWQVVRGDIENGDTTLIDTVNDLLQAQPDPINDNLGLGWTNTILLGMSEQVTKMEEEDVYITLAPTLAPTPVPTSTPTASPTDVPTEVPTGNPTGLPSASPTNTPTHVPSSSPTNTPTQVPTSTPTQTPIEECGPYINDVEDLEFLGVGSDCRAGLSSSWPGGLTCDSPYIVCLPQENTAGNFGGQPYKSTTHRYSVDECLQECANDQRCLGVEFVADSDSALGNCSLVDDIPPEITSKVGSFNYDTAITYENLDSSVTSGNALCFAKENDCNPYFEAGDLNDVMLNCYCPNNRKGYYTKKVKRTVTNTRFCDSDNDVDIRIQKAQANRMFHLCENWCLFNTDDPEAESWYWDPWKTCWREQYAGVGTHMSYCNRVIRSPDTIEMQFINHRTSKTCQSSKPTASPSTMSASWFMADAGDSCDDVCIGNSMVCDENLVAGVQDSTSEAYFTSAGVSCSTIEEGEVDWALPGYEISTSTCLTRHSETENTGCNWSIGVGYKRLCACV